MPLLASMAVTPRLLGLRPLTLGRLRLRSLARAALSEVERRGMKGGTEGMKVNAV